MRKIFALLGVVGTLSVTAQESSNTSTDIPVEKKIITNMEGSKLEFTVLADLDKTYVKSQDRTGTCWSWSTLSFFESEVLRVSNREVELAPMWIVRHTYEEKAIQYIRYNGKVNFGQGGAFHDVSNMSKKYGMVPMSAYTGQQYGEDKHMHGELAAVLQGYLDGVLKNKNGRLTTKWFDGYTAILDAYLGEKPETFTVEGKEYTPMTYMNDYLKFSPDDYVGISSFSHHEFYKPFIIEVEDNWSNDMVYNLPIDEFMNVMTASLEGGFSYAWASDVSENGFSFKRGLAVHPPKTGDWEHRAFRRLEKSAVDSIFQNSIEEWTVTQDERQKMFDNFETTDDHGMHAVGLVKDQNDKKYLIIKNSWGTDSNDCDGYFYASEAFVKAKTMDILIHKDALPKDLKKKLNM